MAMIVPVTASVWGMEYSVHECPKRHKAEAEAMFPGLDVSDLLVVPTCQRTKMDIIKTGEAVDTEKDFCLERFLAFAKAVSDKLVAGGHWADYIDPCSGLSMRRRVPLRAVNKNSQQIYGEVDALVTLLNYQTTNSGCCKFALKRNLYRYSAVVLHPTWGSAVYPASIFTKCTRYVSRRYTKAKPAELAAAIAATEAELKGTEAGA